MDFEKKNYISCEFIKALRKQEGPIVCWDPSFLKITACYGLGSIFCLLYGLL